MKVLLYTLNFSPELIGSGKYSGEFAEWMNFNRLETHVLTTPPYYPAWKVSDGRYRKFRYHTELRENMVVTRCPLFVPNNPTPFSRVLHLSSFAISSMFALFFKKRLFKPDLLILNAG